MQIEIPNQIQDVYKTLTQAGFDVYFVGGCVRNILMNIPVKDWDITTNATPEQIQTVFPDSFYDNQFGTVGIALGTDENKQVVEITTFRSESEYKDNRHPENVIWGKTIQEDLQRRDFAMNAIALRFTQTSFDQFEFIDPYNGQKDIKEKVIRAVGDPKLRFKEDALRLMRAVRFATTLSFSIKQDTLDEISKDAALLQNISAERIHDELMKILASNFAYDGVMLLKNTGLLAYIIPELLKGIGVSQVRPGRHHTEDVFTHNVLSLKLSPSTDSIVKFATLLHDVGKPYVVGKDEQGLVTFYNHEIVGAKIAKDICERLRFSKKERDKIVTLIRWHMFTVDEHTTDAAIRRFIRRVGEENIHDMIDLRIADRLGSGTATAESWRLKLFKQRLEGQLAPPPFSINDLAIDGNDIMKELNIKPGKQIGILLKALFEEVDEDLALNKRDYLLKRLKELPYEKI
jgi:putative nucleotidyltransferase with HDIG domain